MRLIVIAGMACLLAAPAAQSAAPPTQDQPAASGQTQPVAPTPAAGQTKPDVKNYGYCLDGTKHIPGIPCKDGTKFDDKNVRPGGDTNAPPPQEKPSN
jgi:hypothetical protein